MLFIVLRKIWNNKWMITCLLVGSILAVAIISSIPMYRDGILQRMLIKDMEIYQANNNASPAVYTLDFSAFGKYETADERMNAFNWFKNKFEREMVPALNVPYLAQSVSYSMDYNTVKLRDPRNERNVERSIGISAFSKYRDHMKITAGKYPSSEIKNDIIEVMITEACAEKNGFLLSDVVVGSEKSLMLPEVDYYYQIVGFYEPTYKIDPWWQESISNYEQEFIVDYKLFIGYYINHHSALTSAQWRYVLDYTQLKVANIQNFTNLIKDQTKYFDRYRATNAELNSAEILFEYFTRENQLTLTLLVLQMPLLIMLAFYLFMVSQLIVDNERVEIAMLRTRGASKFQVFMSYLMQSAILSISSIIIGPFVALLICKVLGSTNGFLEFINRAPLPAIISDETMLYALLAGVFSIFMMMIPIFRAMNTSLLDLRQKKGRKRKTAFWKKVFLDVILLGLSIYGLYQYNMREETMLLTDATGMEVPIDPAIFFLSTLFVLGTGLFFIRMYPLLIRLIYWLGRRIWPATLYASFLQVSRSGGKEAFLMLFIILTLSVGVFSANSARTINQNTEDKVLYKNGSDMVVQYSWTNNIKYYYDFATMRMELSPPSEQPDVVYYNEPLFLRVDGLNGTKASAKVLNQKKVTIIKKFGSGRMSGVLMAVDSKEFSDVVWSREGLMEYDINTYLNFLSTSPDALIVSTEIASTLDLTVGEVINITWRYGALNITNSIIGTVYGIVDYWPTINPYDADVNGFVIANLSYVQSYNSVTPYEVWYKKAESATTKMVYDDINEKELKLDSIRDTNTQLVTKKNDPLLLGTNGTLTMTFTMTMLISFIGFVIYWLLSLQSRVLQFGIFRAMGLSKTKVILMIVFEQILISVTAIIMGIFVGNLTSDLFVPLFELVYSNADKVPPFLIISSRADYVKIYIVVGAMLLSGFTILGIKINNIKIAQALKLGED